MGSALDEGLKPVTLFFPSLPASRSAYKTLTFNPYSSQLQMRINLASTPRFNEYEWVVLCR